MQKKITLILTFLIMQLHAVTIIENGLSFDDVLLVPQHSSVTTRRALNTQTILTNNRKTETNICLNIPIISSNMDTVTESDMAIAMAQLGGIGFIHRFNTIAQQVHEVTKVKRFRHAIIKHPITIDQHATVEQAQQLMDEKNIKGLLVVDNNNTLVGIVTARDIRFCHNTTQSVSEYMTGQAALITGASDISIEQAKQLMTKNRIEKLPLVREDWTIAGLITLKDIHTKTEFPHAAVDNNGCLLVGAAIGVKDDALQRAEALIYAGADILVVDIAHGDSDLAIAMIKKVKAAFPETHIVAGNVATPEGTKALIDAGADAIKVGIGPGSICTTRIKTGSGFPQLSAIINCAQEAEKYGIPVIADGGIRYSGDITKAIAAGASTVMLGSLLAGTEESPGQTIVRKGKKCKVIRGMASFGANLGRNAKTNIKNNNNAHDFVPEGIEALKPYKGLVAETMRQLIGGLQSGMSYCGVTTINDLCGNGVFVQISPAVMRTSHAHDVMQL